MHLASLSAKDLKRHAADDVFIILTISRNTVKIDQFAKTLQKMRMYNYSHTVDDSYHLTKPGL